MRISFRPLVQADLPLLHTWLNRPHLRNFYQKESISLREVKTKFIPRVEGKTPTLDHVALLEDQPFAKLQCYRIIDYLDYAKEVGLSDGIGIDFFIAEPPLIGRGFGKRMLQVYLAEIAFPKFPQEENCYVCHDIRNSTALHCSKSIGFEFLRNVIEEGLPNKLLVLNRKKIFAKA